MWFASVNSHRISSRSSNYELLRIVCIIFITALHFLFLGVYRGDITASNEIQFWALNSFFYIGANTFIILSGYFSIKPRLKTFINLFLCIVFYNTLCFLCNSFEGCDVFTIKSLIVKCLCFPISHHRNWFIEGYVFLFLLSPILNIAINTMKKKQFIFVIVFLICLNEYFGYFWKVPTYNVDGYNGHQFVFLYMIGAYIKKFIDDKWIQKHKYHHLMGYLFLSIVYIVLIYINNSFRVPHWDPWKYNNPLLLMSTISFFLFFGSLKVNSSKINIIALASFPVFLCQCCLCSLYSFVWKIWSLLPPPHTYIIVHSGT